MIDKNEELIPMTFIYSTRERALAAHYKEGGEEHTKASSGLVVVDGLKYVVLRTGDRMLAVYRINNNGSLRKLRRIPKAMDNLPAELPFDCEIW